MVAPIMIHRVSPSPDRTLPRRLLPGLIVALLLAGCAPTGQERQPEGHVVFHTGSQPGDAAAEPMTAGPPLRRVAILTPTYEPTRTADWTRLDRRTPEGSGVVMGFGIGMTILQSTPMFLLAWPMAAGVVAGSTILGAVGQVSSDAPYAALEAPDQASLSEVASRLQPDLWLRQDVAEALARRIGNLPARLPWYPTLGPDAPGTDPLTDARREGFDGLLNLVVESFGLAVGEEQGAFGVFVRIRSQWIEVSSGRVRYQRILEQGPGHATPGLPRPADHTLGLLALDRGLVFRQEVREVVAGLARVLAQDPALPIAAKE